MSSSWFSLSLPNPFNSHDDQSPPYSPTASAVNSDLSVLTETLGRQLHTVATFLAPPPEPPLSYSPPPPPPDVSGETPSSSSSYRGIKNDLAEIGDSFKALISSNKAVSKISKFASNFLQFDESNDVEEVDAVGITDEVIDFVREISVRSECWIDFPLSLQEKDYTMSNDQKDHATVVEQLVPSLPKLRHIISHYMSEEKFWMIYFIMVLPRFNEDDYKLLSTPEIVQAREELLQKLRNKNNTPVEVSEDTEEENQWEPEASSSFEEGKLVNCTEQINKLPCENANLTHQIETENREISESSPIDKHHEDDVSFSDLEDDDNDLSGKLSGIKKARTSNVSSQSESSDWVKLQETSGTQGGQRKSKSAHRERYSEGEDSTGWLTVEDGDDLDA